MKNTSKPVNRPKSLKSGPAAAKVQRPVAKKAANKAASRIPQAIPPVKRPAPKPAAVPVPAKPAAMKPQANMKPTLPNGSPRPAGSPAKATAKAEPMRVTSRPEPVIPADKDLSSKHKSGPIKDRIVLMVPDPYWLHCYWELSLQSVQRAEAALGQDWHQARPIIRLFDVTAGDTTSTAEGFVRDIPIHGGCSHWYIDVPQPPKSYRTDIGYMSKRGQFYVLARSNVVTPPIAGSSEALDDNWAHDLDAASADRILAMSTAFEKADGPSALKELFDEQFRRPVKEGSFGGGAAPGKLKKFAFDLDAELIVFGRSDPNATITLQNEPVKLRPDGSFTMRFSLPDSRQIIPAVATSADGLEEQTIVLAVERNIKRLDPMVHDQYGE